MTVPPTSPEPRPRPIAAAAFAAAALIVVAPTVWYGLAAAPTRESTVYVPRTVAAKPAAAPEATKPAPVVESSAPTPDVKPAPILREIRVRLACDEEFRSRPNWKSEAALRLTFASEVYEREFGIRWRIVDVAQWESDDAAESLEAMLEEMGKKVSASGVDVVVGLTGQRAKQGATKQYEFYGMANFFGPTAICAAEYMVDTDGQDTGVLCHELGHVLGAWHSREFSSVMAATVVVTPPWFDAVTRETIEVGRDVDFARGVESLGPEREARLAALYHRGHGKVRCGFAPASAWEVRAARLVKETSSVDAALAYERAASLYRAAEGDGTRTEMTCLLEASRDRSAAGDADAALADAERAAEMADRFPASEATVGTAADRLAELVERRGDKERAAVLRTAAKQAKDKASAAAAKSHSTRPSGD